jgi:hypothetical protein
MATASIERAAESHYQIKVFDSTESRDSILQEKNARRQQIMGKSAAAIRAIPLTDQAIRDFLRTTKFSGPTRQKKTA